MTKIRNLFAQFIHFIWVLPVDFINSLFDVNLIAFRKAYDKEVHKILPPNGTSFEVIKSHFIRMEDRYYKHKDDRRNIFVFFFLTIPTFFGAIFFLKSKPEMLFETKIMIGFAVFFTWITIQMFNIYRRKVYKKVAQLLVYEERYPELGNKFSVSVNVHYSQKKLRNKYISTTNLYRITVIVVFVALVYLFVGALRSL